MTLSRMTPAALMAALVAFPVAAADPGKMLAQACAGCHGQSGEGLGSVPDIRGYDRAFFAEVWQDFREDRRPATIMNRIARGYTEDEVAALADYFARAE